MLSRRSSAHATRICRTLPLIDPVPEFSSSRATCIVSVEPPETTRPDHSACPIARSMAQLSTPLWRWNRLSSYAISMSVSRGSTPPLGTASLIRPSSTAKARMRWPSRSRISTEVSASVVGSTVWSTQESHASCSVAPASIRAARAKRGRCGRLTPSPPCGLCP